MTPNLSTLKPQIGTLNRPFRLITAIRNGQVAANWIDKEYKYHWWHVFRYEDDRSYFALETDYNEKLTGVKLNHEETKELL
jgi:hypothetical protein